MVDFFLNFINCVVVWDFDDDWTLCTVIVCLESNHYYTYYTSLSYYTLFKNCNLHNFTVLCNLIVSCWNKFIQFIIL